MKKLLLILCVASLTLGVASLVVPVPAYATPRLKCTIEPGDPGCPPCTQWDGHRCRCAKIPSCKLLPAP